MRLVWTIKVYNTGGIKTPFRAKIEGPGQGYDGVWVNGDGKGTTEAEAYGAALASMDARKPVLTSP